MSIMSALNTAFPDLKFDIQNVTVEGGQCYRAGDMERYE